MTIAGRDSAQRRSCSISTARSSTQRPISQSRSMSCWQRAACPVRPLRQVTVMIGNGVEKLVERAFAAAGQPLAGAELAQALRDMAPIYRRHDHEPHHAAAGRRGIARRSSMCAAPAWRGDQQAAGGDAPDPAPFRPSGSLQARHRRRRGGRKKPAPDALLLALEKMRVEPGRRHDGWRQQGRCRRRTSRRHARRADPWRLHDHCRRRFGGRSHTRQLRPIAGRPAPGRSRLNPAQ